MSTSIELEIRRLLKTKMALNDIERKLVKKIAPESTPHQDRVAVMNFLIHSGLDNEAFQIFSELIAKKLRTPWGLFIFLLDKHQLKPSRDVIESIIKGLKKQNAMSDILTVRLWDHRDERFQQMRGQTLQTLNEQKVRFKETLREKLGFLKNQRMIEEEGKVLRLLKRLYPQDADIQQAEADFQERWARNVIATRSLPQFEDGLHDHTETEHSPEIQSLLGILLEDMQKIVLQNRGPASDFAIMFNFMSAPHQALEILSYAEPVAAVDWLRIIFLIECRRFVDCLEELNKLELKYKEDPESSFAISYARAFALRGLGQYHQSLEMLKSILNIRPAYRSALSYFKEWSEGAT